MKLKTPRKTVVRIVKDAIKKYNQDQKKNPTIRPGFKKPGQDCYDKDLSAFKAYLSNLQLLTLTGLTPDFCWPVASFLSASSSCLLT